MNCKNCNEKVLTKFCGNCGQSADTHEINFHFLIHEIQHSIFHFDKGIFYTAKLLFKRPGHTIREYIEGKRAKHFKPLAMVVLLATIYTFLMHYSKYIEITTKLGVVNNDPKIAKQFLNPIKLTEWVVGHLAIISLATLPIYALSTYVSFRGKKYFNFIQHIVLQAYITSMLLIIRIVFSIIYYFDVSAEAIFAYTTFDFLLGIVINFWVYFQFFDRLNENARIFRTFLSYLFLILFFGCVLIIFGIVAFLVGYLSVKKS